MIFYHVKGLVINTLLFALRFLPEIYFKKIRRKLYIKQLGRKDGPASATEIARDSGVIIGKDCRVYGGTSFGSEPYLIELGDNVLISGNVQFITHDGGINIFRKEITNIVFNFGKIKVGSNCFIGYGAIILPNVSIGNYCIICAGAVVADSFPDDSVIMGNPAKIIFKTSLYKKMKLASRLTLTNDEVSYPESDSLPECVRKKLILDGIGDIPIRKPRTKRNTKSAGSN
jgi:acetyltransferase-like isoleucine patch superfamily enzyme